MATPGLARASDVAPLRADRKRAERAGARGMAFKTAEIDRSAASRIATEAGVAHKRLHFVSGHWRRSEAESSRLVNGEMRVWVRGHWRGNPELGTVTTTFKAGRKLLKRLEAA
jgi:hypothetical protein